jgi:hypothetical protein
MRPAALHGGACQGAHGQHAHQEPRVIGSPAPALLTWRPVIGVMNAAAERQAGGGLLPRTNTAGRSTQT